MSATVDVHWAIYALGCTAKDLHTYSMDCGSTLIADISHSIFREEVGEVGQVGCGARWGNTHGQASQSLPAANLSGECLRWNYIKADLPGCLALLACFGSITDNVDCRQL